MGGIHMNKKNMLRIVGTCLMAGLSAPAFAEQMVVGGKAVSIDEAPWTVKLSFGCTGSWIGGRWGLTAKHCGTPAYITAGITKKSEASTAALRTAVKRTISHPSADIALMEFSQDITSTRAKPIRPATKADATAGLTDPGKMARLSGWGQLGQNASAPDSLNMLDHKIATKGTPTGAMIYFGGAIGSTLQGSCFGDSGGPLAAHDATGIGWIQIGTVSGGSAVCGDSDPDSYGRVSQVEEWIRQNTGGSVDVFPVTQAVPTLAFASGHIRLSQPQNLVIILWDLSGSQLSRMEKHFEAGEHVLPAAFQPATAAVLDIRGPQFRMHQRVTPLP